MDFEGIMQSEISQIKTNTYYLHGKSEKAKLIETEIRMEVTRGWGIGGEGEMFVKQYKLSVI